MFTFRSIQTWQRCCLMVGTLVLIVAQVVNVPALAFTQQDYLNNLKKQEDLKNKINQTKGQERTLASQIAQMDNQISLNELELADTQGQIQSTQNLLVQVNSNIDQVSTKLGRLDSSIGQMQDAAEARIRAAYKQSRTPSFAAIISASDFKEAMLNFTYIKQMEEADNKILAEINENRKNYNEQKENLAKLKSEKENLAAQLEDKEAAAQTQQKELNEAKSNKSALLERTRGDESVYQRLLAQARAEASAMASALSTGQRFRVERGQVIAFEGNSGCTSGPHLHFGYRRVNLGTRIGSTIASGSWINPKPYLDNGTLGIPLAGYPGNITQYFGVNEVGIYGPGGHPAMDMAQPYGTAIRAAQSGWAQRMTDGGCPAYSWLHHGPGKGIIITGDDGTQTLYWHIQ